MKLNVRMIREIFKMLNEFAVDYPTFPVNQRFFHLIVTLAKPFCGNAAIVSRQTFGIRMVHRETFFASTPKLIELKNKMPRMYPIRTKIISDGATEHRSLEQKGALVDKEECCTSVWKMQQQTTQ